MRMFCYINFFEVLLEMYKDWYGEFVFREF